MTTKRNEIIVPNSKLSSTILENYSTPTAYCGFFYEVGVDYKEDVKDVEKVILEALKKAAKKNDLMDEDSIWVRFDSFGDFSLNFKFGYRVKGYVNRFSALKDVNHELFYAFKKNGVGIPFPVRVVYNKNEKGKKN